jgi:hypothetical protein
MPESEMENTLIHKTEEILHAQVQSQNSADLFFGQNWIVHEESVKSGILLESFEMFEKIYFAHHTRTLAEQVDSPL